MRDSQRIPAQLRVAGRAEQPAELRDISIRGCVVIGTDLQAAAGDLVDLLVPDSTASATKLEGRVTSVRAGGFSLEFLRLSPAGLIWVAERIDEAGRPKRE
jgi:hypothetical protein